MATYKLIYFEIKALAENSRILLELAGQPFEDKRLTWPEWKETKGHYPFHKLPVLEITENSQTVQIAQSRAIERYLANKFDLAGKNDIERAQCDMIIEQIRDMFDILIVIYFKKFDDENEKKKELAAAIRDKIVPSLKLIEANVLGLNDKSGGNGFLVGDAMSLADVALINFYDWLRESKSEVLENVPLLKLHEEKIKGIPKISEHLKKNACVRLGFIFPN